MLLTTIFYSVLSKTYLDQKTQQESVNVQDNFNTLNFQFFLYSSNKDNIWHWSAWKDPLLFTCSSIIGGLFFHYCLMDADGREKFIEEGQYNSHIKMRPYLPNCISIFPIASYLFIFLYSGIIFAIRSSYSQVNFFDYFYIMMFNFSLCVLCYGSFYPVFSLPIEAWNHLIFYNWICGKNFIISLSLWILSTVGIAIFGSYLFNYKFVLIGIFCLFLILHIVLLILEILYMNIDFSKKLNFISEEKYQNLKENYYQNFYNTQGNDSYEEHQSIFGHNQILPTNTEKNIEMTSLNNSGDFHFSLQSNLDINNNDQKL